MPETTTARQAPSSGPRAPDAWRDLAAADLTREAEATAPDPGDAVAIEAASDAGWTVSDLGYFTSLHHPVHGQLYQAAARMWRWVPPGAVVPAASFVRLEMALEYAAGAADMADLDPAPADPQP